MRIRVYLGFYFLVKNANMINKPYLILCIMQHQYFLLHIILLVDLFQFGLSGTSSESGSSCRSEGYSNLKTYKCITTPSTTTPGQTPQERSPSTTSGRVAPPPPIPTTYVLPTPQASPSNTSTTTPYMVAAVPAKPPSPSILVQEPTPQASPSNTNTLAPKGSPSPSKRRLSTLEKVLIGMAIVVAVIVSVAMIIVLRYRLRNGLNQETNPNVENFLLNNEYLDPKRFKYSQIKKITSSFRDKLGQGGYGSVYKGKLPSGKIVAVKLLKEITSNGEGFINEVGTISKTSHVNIVNLLGFCYERNRGALVYEFMPNKSLDKFISTADGSLNTLDLETLFKIAVGVARGLEYLHKGCKTKIVHFDIKPQNILLDQDFCPKISDFGLAKLCKKQQSIVSIAGTIGTRGYIAPEVFSRIGGGSHKSDVYSYGMMVLQMAGGRNITSMGSIQSSESCFPDTIYEEVILQENRNMDDILREEEAEATRKMFLVGFWCIQTVPSDRPSMSKVVEMLEGSLQSIQIPPKPYLFNPTNRQVKISVED